jgi:uncharacterized protein YcfL
MKTFLMLLLAFILLVGCASYTRNMDGSIVAKGGTVVLVYGPDGKTIVGESFTPNNQSGLGLPQLIELLKPFMKLAP